jgi:CBS domain-containing protein
MRMKRLGKLRAEARKGLEDEMKILDIMNPRVVTCRVKDHLGIAAKKMSDCDIGCLPVLDKDGKVVAMITDRDICMAAYKLRCSPFNIPISVAMSKELFFCGPNDNIIDTEVRMISLKVRRLPVLNPEGNLIGIVSLNDLACETERQTGRQVIRGIGHRKGSFENPCSNNHN